MEPSSKRCIGCGKAMPSRATDKGWTLTQCSGKGRGQRWYRQCGCMDTPAYHWLVDDLFDRRRAYPLRFPVRRAENAAE